MVVSRITMAAPGMSMSVTARALQVVLLLFLTLLSLLSCQSSSPSSCSDWKNSGSCRSDFKLTSRVLVHPCVLKLWVFPQRITFLHGPLQVMMVGVLWVDGDSRIFPGFCRRDQTCSFSLPVWSSWCLLPAPCSHKDGNLAASICWTHAQLLHSNC